MKKHINCYFFRSGDREGFYVQHPQSGADADYVKYADCHFTTRGKDQIVKVVDHVHGVTYVPSEDCPYFQE